MVISTDGQHSLAALIYENPNITFSSVDPEQSGPTIIGFDSGLRGHADVGKILLQNNRTLEATNVYRIDGMSSSEHFFTTHITLERVHVWHKIYFRRGVSQTNAVMIIVQVGPCIY